MILIALNLGHWSVDEDALLVFLMSQGLTNWGKIAMQIPNRSWKQCRERWLHHLDPSVLKTEFTPEEDGIILQLQAEQGNKWSQISKMLPGRTVSTYPPHDLLLSLLIHVPHWVSFPF